MQGMDKLPGDQTGPAPSTNSISGGNMLQDAIRSILQGINNNGAFSKMSMPSVHGLNQLGPMQDVNSVAQADFNDKYAGQQARQKGKQSSNPSLQGFMNNVSNTGDKIAVSVKNLAHPLLALIQGQQDAVQQNNSAGTEGLPSLDGNDKQQVADNTTQQQQPEEEMA